MHYETSADRHSRSPGVRLLYHRGGLRQPLTSSKVLLGLFIMQLYKKALRKFV